MDGQFLQGVGSVLGGAAALGALALTMIGAPRLLAYMQDRTIVITERDEARVEWAHEKSSRVAAETRAQNWEDAARGAQFDLEAMVKRIEALEEQIALVDARSHLAADYTRRLLAWGVKADADARRLGYQLTPMPTIPQELVPTLTADA